MVFWAFNEDAYLEDKEPIAMIFGDKSKQIDFRVQAPLDFKFATAHSTELTTKFGRFRVALSTFDIFLNAGPIT